MEKTYLEQIKEAERIAAKTLTDAVHKSEHMLFEAAKENELHEQQVIGLIEAEYKKMIEAAHEQAKKNTEAADVYFSEQCEIVEKNAAEKIDNAVSYIVKKVTE